MNYFKYLFLVVAISTCSVGCYFADDDDGGGFLNCENGEGNVVTQILDVPEFTGIQLNNSIDVYLQQGLEQKVEMEAQENIIDLLELDVQDDIWDIEFDRCIRDHKDIKLYITAPLIDFIGVSGSGQVYGENQLEGEDLELKIVGSGDIDLAVLVQKIDARISGSGNIDLEGLAEEFEVKITASGDYNAFDLETQKGEITINASGDAEVLVNETLDITINGSGDVDYKGYPLLDIEINGSGDVNNAN